MRLKEGAAHRLYETRERLGLSRADLEKRTDTNGFKVPEGTIFTIEKGVSRRPYPRTIYALAEALGLDANDLLEAEEVSA